MNLGGTFTFPQTNITVSRMGYGAMQLAGPHVFGPPKDHAAALSVLREAVSSGVNHIDTSDFYGPHITNQIIKEALHPYPADLTLVTKVGARRGSDGSWILDREPASLRSQVQDNLKNLGVDSLTIVNMRLGDVASPNDDTIVKQVEELASMQREGLIQHIGLSTVTQKQYESVRSVAKIVCVQNLYNLAHREDDSFVDFLAKEGVAFVPYFPLGGFTPLQSSTLDEVAQSLGQPPMAVAQAWLLHRAANILLIPGTSSLKHLRENLAAASLTLSEETMLKLNTIGLSN
ncbi:MAG: oxidoreductase [Janthinobacterium lividum]